MPCTVTQNLWCRGHFFSDVHHCRTGKSGKVAGLLIPATLTAMLVGITEPLEFTFLFISPLLFAVHAVLAASMSTVMYLFGVVGNMGGGLIDRFYRKTGSRCSATTRI
ncbi:hypothetical protein FA039_26070 [Escherichia coli]|nr:hypothetical protein [Escherichia coli]